jgi:hypothetical protein
MTSVWTRARLGRQRRAAIREDQRRQSPQVLQFDRHLSIERHSGDQPFTIALGDHSKAANDVHLKTGQR